MSRPDYSLSLLPNFPIAKQQAHRLSIHNKIRTDNYYWMRDDDRQDEQVLAHLHAENAYCDEQLAAMKPLQNTLFEELKARIVKDDNSVPVKDGKYWYHSEVRGDDEYSRHYRSTSIKANNKELLLSIKDAMKLCGLEKIRSPIFLAHPTFNTDGDKCVSLLRFLNKS
mgnify:CR=1 FL=1